ncbi:amidohydrolase family protein [Tenacibaculum xiamenense]|uniref:amidohydrolase family protein n=1 Tax=Tenacibaculum xiamenense TaxID=1261553 RepID=UPI0038945F37
MTYKIHDSDRHVIEPIEIWEQYVEKEIFEKHPVYLKTNKNAKGEELPAEYMIGSYPIVKYWTKSLQEESNLINKETLLQRHQAKTGVGQLQSMDLTNIAIANIFPTFALGVIYHSEIPSYVAVAYAKAYNKWLNDYCNVNPKRLKAVGIINRHDPYEMIVQVKEVISYGWKTIILRPEEINGRTLGHKDYEGFWKICTENNISIAFHGGAHFHGKSVGTDRFNDRFSLLATTHPFEIISAFISLLTSGVLERYPTLKFAFLEAGSSWLPYWLWRLDTICYPDFPNQTKENIKMLPSEYFKRQCWIAIEPGEPCLREVINIIGSNRLLFASDFPHPDHEHLNSDDVPSKLPELTDSELKEIFELNAREFFNYEEEHEHANYN